jgi:hypothetical protein
LVELLLQEPPLVLQLLPQIHWKELLLVVLHWRLVNPRWLLEGLVGLLQLVRSHCLLAEEHQLHLELRCYCWLVSWLPKMRL